MKCLWCAGSFQKKHQQKFCSNTCQHSYQTKTRIDLAIKNQSLSGLSPKTAKSYAILLWGHECNICHYRDWNNEPIPLVLDHINGNSDDWSFTNLRLICCNCDAQTDTYKNKNRGFGRFLRRKRYTEGKSY